MRGGTYSFCPVLAHKEARTTLTAYSTYEVHTYTHLQYSIWNFQVDSSFFRTLTVLFVSRTVDFSPAVTLLRTAAWKERGGL